MATRKTKSTKTTKAKSTTPTKAKKTAAAPKAATAAAPKATATKVAAKTAVAAPKATVVEAVKPVVAGAPIKKPELVERVMAETGMKKKDVKPVVEAMLTVLGRALSEGEELNVPPLGKVMINRVKDVANAKIMNVKLRHPTAVKKTDNPPLAEAAE